MSINQELVFSSRYPYNISAIVDIVSSVEMELLNQELVDQFWYTLHEDAGYVTFTIVIDDTQQQLDYSFSDILESSESELFNNILDDMY